MQLSDIQNLLASWLDDANQGYFTPAQTLPWIQLAHKQVQLILLNAGQNYYQIPVETYCVTGQSDYLFPSDFLIEHRLEIILNTPATTTYNENRQPLVAITTNQQDQIELALGPPTNYVIKKDRYTVSPTPDLPYLMRLYYSPLVYLIQNPTDVPDCPDQFVELIPLLAAFNGFIKDDRAPANLTQKLEDFKMLVKQLSTNRTQDASRQVVQTEVWDTGGWMY